MTLNSTKWYYWANIYAACVNRLIKKSRAYFCIYFMDYNNGFPSSILVRGRQGSTIYGKNVLVGIDLNVNCKLYTKRIYCIPVLALQTFCNFDQSHLQSLKNNSTPRTNPISAQLTSTWENKLYLTSKWWLYKPPIELVQRFGYRRISLRRNFVVVISSIWLGYIVCLSQWGGRGSFTSSNCFYLPSRQLHEGVFRINIQVHNKT
jgi:hypothetical protein